ncbi:MAG: hypothetical protein AAF598_08750 [Bacteroidota bacterium]
MDHPITAAQFLEFWKQSFSKYLEKELAGNWDNKMLKTDKIIGPAYANSDQSPIGNHLQTHFKAINLSYRTEDWKVDLALSSQTQHGPIQNMHLRDESVKFDDNWFYPRHYDILIEQENVMELCYHEMIKLTHLKARLKVLITYNYEYPNDSKEEAKTQQTIDFAIANFKRIINNANNDFPENPATEYLLIIGQPKTKNGTTLISWEDFTFSYTGELKMASSLR